MTTFANRETFAVAVAAVLLCASAGLAQNQSMPGMNMQKTAPQAQQTQPAKPDIHLPQDMRNLQNTNDAAARKESQSERNSERQQREEPMQKPGQQSDSQSATHSTLTLQEPENPGHITGEKLPAPDLLGEIEKRAPMTLQDFLTQAEHSNPTLAESRADVLSARAQARQAALYPNPSIGYSGDQIRGGSYGGGEQGAYIQQKIVLGGKLGLRRNIHNQQARSNEIGVEEQQYRVHNDVEQAFYRALVSQAKVAMRQRIMRVALDAAETAHQLANVGQADAPDILQAEVEAGQAKIEYVTEQRNFIRDFQTLAALAGLQNLAASPLQGDIESPPALDAEHQIATVVAASPAVKRAQQVVVVAEARLKDARREPVPDLTLRAGEWYSGEEVSGAHVAAGPMSFASAAIDLPVWNRNQGNILAAKAALERAKEDVVRTQLSLKQQAEPLVQQYLAATFEADRYRTDLVPSARRAYELYLMKYQQMAGAYPQVLISQRTMFQLQIGYLTALREVWSSALSLQNYTLTGGLRQPMASGPSSTAINLPNGGGNE